jgi:hypothetical protein
MHKSSKSGILHIKQGQNSPNSRIFERKTQKNTIFHPQNHQFRGILYIKTGILYEKAPISAILSVFLGQNNPPNPNFEVNLAGNGTYEQELLDCGGLAGGCNGIAIFFFFFFFFVIYYIKIDFFVILVGN